MAKYVLSVDPGKLQCGVAVFKDGVLVHATLAKNHFNKPGDDGPECWRNTARAVLNDWNRFWVGSGRLINTVVAGQPMHLVLEIPVIRKAGLQKGDQADVLCLAGVDGAIAALFDCPVIHYKPEQWGGQTPKAIKNERTLKRLSPEELKAIDPKVPKSLVHNVIDSVSIGLFYLGRYR